MKRHPMVWFYVLAFAIAWLGWLPVVAGSRGVALFQAPYFQALLLLPALAPLAAALIVTAASGKKGAVGALLAGLLRWRVSILWYVLALILPALIFLGGQVIDLLFSQEPLGLTAPAQQMGAAAVIVEALAMSLVSNICEEVGWRGFALPRLQAKHSTLAATLLVGLLWGGWHLPLFFWIGNAMAEYPFLPWFVSLMGQTFIYTWLYNRTGGSLLIVSLFHISVNTLGALLAGSVPGVAVASAAAAVVVVVALGPARAWLEPATA